MALPEMRVKIAADTTDVQTDFKKLNKTLNQLENKIGMTVNASGRLVDKFGQTKRITKSLEEAMQKAGVKTDDLADIMLQARNQATGLGRAMKVANDNVRVGTNRLSAATSQNRNFGLAMQNVSFQVGDFATQVGAGTAASIALGQQLPQLLGGFGILGAALGAVVAIGVPLGRVLAEAKVGSELLGALAPAGRAVGEAFAEVGKNLRAFAEVAVNNIDRVVAVGVAAAAFYGGRWVVSFIAAGKATRFASASVALLGRVIRKLPFMLLIGVIGEAILQMSRLTKATGGVGAAFALVADTMRLSWRGALAVMAKEFGEWIISISESVIGSGLPTAIKKTLLAPLTAIGDKLLKVFDNFGGAKAVDDAANAVKNLLKMLEAGKEKGLTLDSILGGGKGDKDAADAAKEREKLHKEEMQRQRERLQEGLQAIRESQLTEQQMLFAHLLEKKALIDEAYEQGLTNDIERKELERELQAEHNRKMLELEDRKQQEDTAKKGALFQKIAGLQKGNLSEQLSNNVKFWGQLAQQTNMGGKQVFAAIQILAAAEGLVNSFLAFTQVLRDPRLGFYEKIAAAAAVLASGLQMVQAIKSVTSSGGGGGAAASAGGGGGGGTAGSIAPAESSRPRGPAVSLTLVGDQGFSRAQIVQIAEALNDAGDEGQLVQIMGRR
jgi:hypothetical protein